MKMTGAQAIIKALEIENVEIVFGYPGAAICPFYDALVDSGIKHVLTRHEQGAAHAASGYARATGKPGVCISTSGPGATNLITGIATAYMDSIPLVAITGQVSTEQIGRDVFQEADITGATAPFCKHGYLVKNVEDLQRIIKEAFYIATTGRPGPVIIDIPIDVQNKECDFDYPENINIRGYKPTYKGHAMQIKKAADLISSCKQPVICAGGGVISGGASSELIQFAEKCRIPVVTTLMGKGSIPSEHPLNYGMLGSHGVYAANHAVYNADLLIILGARVGDRAMTNVDRISRNARIIHVDIDPAEIGKNIDTEIPIVGHVKNVLSQLIEETEQGDVEEWNRQLDDVRKKHPLKYTQKKDFVNPKYLMTRLSERITGNHIVTTEVGQNQIWAANYLQIKRPGAFITSGGMGTMGYGLPAAVGAKIGSRESTVIAIAGDGSFQMSMQELGTIKQENIVIKIILLNNSRLGMVRELQKAKYKSRYSQVILESNPDFIKLAEAYGFKGETIKSDDQIDQALDRMFSDDKTYILECIVDPEEGTL